LWQRFRVGNEWYRVWFPADDLLDRAGLVKSFPHAALKPNPKVFKPGEDILKVKVLAGDHLFVDRLTYNFRPPNRGEIIVFETKGIPEENRDRWGIPGDQFYIKRLVGLSGETLSIHEDGAVVNVPQFGTVSVGHLVVNGQPLSATTPHFENLYSFNGASGDTKQLSYQEHHYFGHGMIGLLVPGSEFQIRTNYSFVMGDNTMNSLDSRYWGDFPSDSVIGRALFVYWPVANRFGWGCLSN